MIYSGVDMIRTSGQQVERLERLKVVETPPVQPASDSPASREDTQNALLRFAKFVKDEGKKKKTAPLKRQVKQSGLPEGYLNQLPANFNAQRSGGMIDVYI